jgi:hypothetical protein
VAVGVGSGVGAVGSGVGSGVAVAVGSAVGAGLSSGEAGGGSTALRRRLDGRRLVGSGRRFTRVRHRVARLTPADRRELRPQHVLQLLDERCRPSRTR